MIFIFFKYTVHLKSVACYCIKIYERTNSMKIKKHQKGQLCWNLKHSYVEKPISQDLNNSQILISSSYRNWKSMASLQAYQHIVVNLSN